jgi:Glycosyl transferase family 2
LPRIHFEYPGQAFDMRSLFRRALVGSSKASRVPAERPADYPAWLALQLAERAALSPFQAPSNFVSILTCIYRGSPADCFRETVESVLRQTPSAFEWVVLENGQVDGDLQSVLAELAGDARVHLVHTPRNVGIIRGLRMCLEAATGDYALPLDGDDLLTPDAVSVIARATLDAGCPEFLYGDEDAWIDGHAAAPYFRPDWDPLLNLSSSYIWHPSVFRRQSALELGVFTDPKSEYCQDWDTVFRFVDGGVAPMHIPEVLYHWRAHAASSTNRPDRDQGSLRSQRHVLERHLDRLGLAESFGVVEFPLDRGLPEWWVRSTNHDAPPMDVIVVGGDAIPRRPADMPCARLLRCDRSDGIAGLRAALNDCHTDAVVVIDGHLRPAPSEWASEAAMILDLLPDVEIVGGRIIAETGVVLAGEILIAPDGRIACPDTGRLAGDAGYYSLTLKPHLADGVTGRFFVARRVGLVQALRELPREATLPHLGAWLGAWTARAGRRVAYTPLLTAHSGSSHEAADTAGPGEQRALADVISGSAAPGRWAWRKRCAELGEGRPLEGGH